MQERMLARWQSKLTGDIPGCRGQTVTLVRRRKWAGKTFRNQPSGTAFLFITVFLLLGGEGKEGLSCRSFLQRVFIEVPGTM